MGPMLPRAFAPVAIIEVVGFDPWPVRLLPCLAWTVRCAGRALTGRAARINQTKRL